MQQVGDQISLPALFTRKEVTQSAAARWSGAAYRGGSSSSSPPRNSTRLPSTSFMSVLYRSKSGVRKWVFLACLMQRYL